MEEKRIKVRLTKNSPYSEYGYYEKGDVGYIDGYVNDDAVIILENGKFAKAGLRWIEVVNDKDKNVNTELKESGDERIINNIKKVIGWYRGMFTEKSLMPEEYQEINAWLEKQAEHANFCNKIQIGDKVTRNKDGVLVNLSQLNRVAKKDEKQGEQKPAWSEEDESMLYGVIETEQYMLDVVNGIKKFDVWNGDIRKACAEELNWLKSLRPQNKQEWVGATKEQIDTIAQHLENIGNTAMAEILYGLRPQNTWKPSDEQMENLSRAINGGTFRTSLLMELYIDLKKLKE